MIRSVTELKAFFLRGLKPSESNFGDLIDSYVHRSDINANIYKIQIVKEVVSITTDTNILTSQNTYNADDTLDLIVNITDDNSYVLTPPHTFTFPYTLRAGDTITIKKFSVVPK